MNVPLKFSCQCPQQAPSTCIVLLPAAGVADSDRELPKERRRRRFGANLSGHTLPFFFASPFRLSFPSPARPAKSCVYRCPAHRLYRIQHPPSCFWIFRQAVGPRHSGASDCSQFYIRAIYTLHNNQSRIGERSERECRSVLASLLCQQIT